MDIPDFVADAAQLMVGQPAVGAGT
jgi:hypothetical protein